MTPTLPAEDVDAIARRVVELLREEPALTTRHLVDAGTLATILGVSRDTIYAKATELGAIRIGTGDRPRLRFDVDRALAASQHEHQAPAPAAVVAQPRRRPTRGADAAPLLPIRARRDAA